MNFRQREKRKGNKEGVGQKEASITLMMGRLITTAQGRRTLPDTKECSGGGGSITRSSCSGSRIRDRVGGRTVGVVALPECSGHG